MSLTKIERAAALARYAHRGQTDKAGKPYWTHPARVAAMVAEDPSINREAIVIAWLHDVVEDTDVTLDEIRQQFGDDTARWVDGITKRKGETREDYIVRVSHIPIVKRVKRCDTKDNRDPERLELLDPAVRFRLLAKYDRDEEIMAEHSTGYSRNGQCAYNGCDRGCCCDIQHGERWRSRPLTPGILGSRMEP